MPTNGRKLAAWRQLEGFSQSQAAAKLSEFVGWNVAQGVWSTWETGRKAPDREMAPKLEEFTGGKVCASDWPSRRRRGRARRPVASAAE